MFISSFRLKTAIQGYLVNLREIVDYPVNHPGRELERQALAESVAYLSNLEALPPSFPTARELLQYALTQAPDRGSVVELGVYKGATIRFIANRLSPRRVHGFDTFTGLPVRWAGNLSTFDAGGQLPKVPDNVDLHVGRFDESLPGWVDDHEEQIALMHVDCDIYESASSAFSCLSKRIGAGTVIVFDEYFNYPGWQRHEFKAFQEFVAANRITYSYLGYSRIQMAVQIDSVGADPDR